MDCKHSLEDRFHVESYSMKATAFYRFTLLLLAQVHLQMTAWEWLRLFRDTRTTGRPLSGADVYCLQNPEEDVAAHSRVNYTGGGRAAHPRLGEEALAKLRHNVGFRVSDRCPNVPSKRW